MHILVAFLLTLFCLGPACSPQAAVTAPPPAGGAPQASPAASAEEFVGPFPSWKNVKTDYGAVGDGRADDTDAIQAGLNDLQLHQESVVLYFPAGTYRITRTLSTQRNAHQHCMGVTIVGEDPATTIIKWDGPPDGMMVKYDAWYSKISRLTLDGAGKAGIALAYGDAFSTYNETSDMVFQDVKVGMSMATGGNGQAENAVLRCKFLRCSEAGLRTNNFNSLDIWCWYCTFEDCGWGLYNGAGNFHAYECLFLRSQKGDIGSANLMVFSFVNNTSVGSHHFVDWAGGHTWGAPNSITGNRIVDFTGDFAIRLGNGGPHLVMDNNIKAPPGFNKPVAVMGWSDQAFIGNTYTVPNPVQQGGRFLSYDERIVDPAEVDTTLPVMPETPPRRERKVFEVPAGADATAIQAAIDSAAALKGQRPVVHLPKGNYKITQTLVIPAGCDVQLIGDGGAETATVLEWAGEPGGLVLHLQGPSVATVRDLSIQAPNGDCILVDNCDQAGGRIFGDQLNLSGINVGRSPIGLLNNGLEQADVLCRNLQGGTFCDVWVKAVGGPETQAGRPGPGQFSVFCGATGTANAQYAVEKGGRLVVRSVYHEMSGEAPQGILLNDSGTLAVDATRFSYKTSLEHPLIKVDGFRGMFTLTPGLLLPVNSDVTARVEITGDGNETNVLVLGNLFWVNEMGVNADKVFLNRAQPPAKAALLLCNMNSGKPGAAKMPGGADGFAFLENRGPDDVDFVLKMLKPLREARIWRPAAGQPGATNVQFHRVICTAGQNGVDLELRAGR